MRSARSGAESFGPKQDSAPQQTRQYTFILILVTVTLLSRLALLSSPYFADGPAHVENLDRGVLFIQPPGYFLFMWSIHWLMGIGLASAAAVSWLNVTLSLCGVAVFAKISETLFSPRMGRALSICYAFMNVVWFSSLIHSTYAPMTFFAPALFYCLLQRGQWWYFLGCAMWALGAGFRPSDGVFLLPMLILGSRSHSWRERIVGLVIGVTLSLTWWLPTADHFGGFFGPVRASLEQASGASEHVSILRVGITPRSLANALRFVAAVATSLNVLLPLAILQMVRGYRDERTLLAMAWIVPGSLFLFLTYMSDAAYIAFMAGGLLILAGMFCERLSWAQVNAWVVVYLVVSLTQMLVLRPVAPSTFPRRVADAFWLEYTAWGVRHHYHKNLSDLERNAGDARSEKGLATQ